MKNIFYLSKMKYLHNFFVINYNNCFPQNALKTIRKQLKRYIPVLSEIFSSLWWTRNTTELEMSISLEQKVSAIFSCSLLLFFLINLVLRKQHFSFQLFLQKNRYFMSNLYSACQPFNNIIVGNHDSKECFPPNSIWSKPATTMWCSLKLKYNSFVHVTIVSCCN